MTEKITVVKLKENISKNPFYSCPGGGTFELNSFHLVGHLTSDLIPGVGHLTNSDFKSSNARGCPVGGMLKFQIDRYINAEISFDFQPIASLTFVLQTLPIDMIDAWFQTLFCFKFFIEVNICCRFVLHCVKSVHPMPQSLLCSQCRNRFFGQEILNNRAWSCFNIPNY